MEKIINNIWVEKYRPHDLTELVGNEHLKNKLSSFITKQEIPNILLYGVFGTGKTSIGNILINNIACDPLYINAVDENDVDVVRTKIKSFVQTVSMHKWKIVFLDEFHRFSMPAQQILRNIVETYSLKTRFVITTNYIEKIDGAMRSRFQEFEVVPPSKLEVLKRLLHILAVEKVKYVDEDVANILNQYYPDIRKITNTLQMCVIDNELILDNSALAVTDFMDDIMKILVDGTNQTTMFRQIRQIIADNKVRDFQPMYKYIYDKMDKITTDINKQSLLILALADAQYQETFVVNKEITFMSSIVQLINTKLN